jgi:hypothetical protein
VDDAPSVGAAEGWEGGLPDAPRFAAFGSACRTAIYPKKPRAIVIYLNKRETNASHNPCGSEFIREEASTSDAFSWP